MNNKTFLKKVIDEYNRASELYPKFHSYHEGYAVLLEELDELWEQVKYTKFTNGYSEPMEKELVQVTAMCLRFAELLGYDIEGIDRRKA